MGVEKNFLRNSKKRITYFKNRIVRYSQPVLFLQNAQFRLLALTYQSESTIWGLRRGVPRTDQSALVWSS